MSSRMALIGQISLAILALQLLSMTTAYNLQQLNVMRESITNLTMANCGRIAGYVRLGFHDSVGEGRVDGCIDLDNPANNGLNGHINTLRREYRNLGLANQDISLADYFAVAAVQAAYIGTSPCAVNCQRGPNGCVPDPEIEKTLKFRTGRTDCTNSPTGEEQLPEQFPEPKWGYPEVLSYFANEFDFDVRCTVAILGAHSLGRAREQNSGFNGAWVRDANVLNNQFYTDIVNDRVWTQSDTSQPPPGTPGGPQKYWRPLRRNGGTGGQLMFNSDMCVAYNMVSINAVDGQVASPCDTTATIDNCGPSPANSIAQEFANNNTAFLWEFGRCFDKMLNNKEETLTEPSS